MEQTITAPKATMSFGNQSDSPRVLSSEPRPTQERNLKQIVFDEAIGIACDWFEATGRHIQKEEFDNLFKAGFASHQSSEVEELFYDWEDYQELSHTYYETPEIKAQKDWETVEALYAEAQAGLLPIELFLKSETYKVDNPKNPNKKKLARHKLTADFAASDVIIQRYNKYLLTGHLLQARPSDQEVTEERKISIALGFTTATGKPLSSLASNIMKSNGEITQKDIDRAIEYLDIYDQIHPKSRKEHLAKLVEAGKPPKSRKEHLAKPTEAGEPPKSRKEHLAKPTEAGEPLPEPEYYYDLAAQKLIVLGRTALKQFRDHEGRSHMERLKKSKKLLVGRVAIKAFEQGENHGSLDSLGYLLRHGLPEGSSPDHMRTMDLTKEDFLEIGRWLSGIVDPADDQRSMHLNESVFMNAKNLGIGFSINKGSRFLNEFGSMSNYYKMLGENKTNKKGALDMQDAIEALTTLANELGRRPTYSEQVAAHRQDHRIPHPATINKRLSTAERSGMEILFELAGIDSSEQTWDDKSFIQWGLEYINENGKLPRLVDLENASKAGACAGRHVFGNYFASFNDFKSQIQAMHQGHLSEDFGRFVPSSQEVLAA